MFLEKLVIEKDNREFHAAQKAKKMEKMKDQTVEENQKLRRKIQQLNEKTEIIVDEIKLSSRKEKNEEKDHFLKEISKKNKVIEELKD